MREAAKDTVELDSHAAGDRSRRKLSARRGWLKVQRPDLVLIREQGAAETGSVSVPAMIAIWIALVDLADEHRTETFTVAIGLIGFRAGLGRRHTVSALEVLERLGLLCRTPNRDPYNPKRQIESTWTIRPATSCKDCKTPPAKERGICLPGSVKPRSEPRGEKVVRRGHMGPPEGAKAASLVPRFEPVRPGLFPGEYQELIAVAEREIERLRSDPANVQRSEKLKAAAAEDLQWLLDEAERKPDRAEALRLEASRLKADPTNYVASGFTPEVKHAIDAWRERVRQIEAALMGVAS